MLKQFFYLFLAVFLCSIVLFVTSDTFAYTDLGGGSCVCGNGENTDGGSTDDACVDCTEAIADASCSSTQYNGVVPVENYDGTCINIESDNETFDCRGNALGGDGDNVGNGIYFFDWHENINILSCEIHDFYYGIYNEQCSSSTVSGNYVHDNTGDGIKYTVGSSETTFDVQNNRSENNAEDGLSGTYFTNVLSDIRENIFCGNLGSGGGTGSCPFLYGWTGSAYNFINDIFPEAKMFILDYVPRLIDTTFTYSPINLVPKDDVYEIQIREEYQEQSYIDYLHLLTIDHPSDYEVYPSHWNSYDTLYTVSKDQFLPLSCLDTNGNSCLATISSDDDDVQKMHANDTLTLDLGDLTRPASIKLVVDRGYAGFQIAQDIDVKDMNGDWVTVSPPFFSPTPTVFNVQTFTSFNVMDLTGLFPTDDYTIRIHSIDGTIFGKDYEEAVAIDYIAVDTSAPRTDYTVTELSPSFADLHPGMLAEYWDDKDKFNQPGYVTPQYSNLHEYLQEYSSLYRSLFDATAYGNVTAKVIGDECDKDNIYTCPDQIITLPGDEITIQFPYTAPDAELERDTIFISNGGYKSLKSSEHTDVYSMWNTIPGHNNICDTFYQFTDLDEEEDPLDSCTYTCDQTDPGTLEGLVWNDENEDGIQDVGEDPFGGIEVELFDTLYNPIGTMTSGIDGAFNFDSLTPGSYFIGVPKPENFEYSPEGDDSVIQPDTGNSGFQFVAASTTKGDVNAGLYSEDAAIGGYVWIDANGNGIYELTEQVLEGATVSLHESDDSLVAQLVTDVHGNFLFTNIPTGTYYVQYETYVGHVFTLIDQGSDDRYDSDALETGRTENMNVETGVLYQTVSAGYVEQQQSTPTPTPTTSAAPTPTPTLTPTVSATPSPSPTPTEPDQEKASILATTGFDFFVLPGIIVAIVLGCIGMIMKRRKRYQE